MTRLQVLVVILAILAVLVIMDSSFETGARSGKFSAYEQAVRAGVARWADEEKTGIEYKMIRNAARGPLGH
jgi:hypothetical protein